MSEMWKSIAGYAGYYEVSNLGRVRSIPRIITRTTGVKERRKGVMLRLHTDKSGYVSVVLCKHRKLKTHWVHVLTARAFIGPSTRRCTVDHSDRKRGRNCASNLLIRSHSQNLLNRPQVPLGKNKVRGVEYDCRYRLPWLARLGRRNIIGRYGSLAEAADARSAAYAKIMQS